MRYRASAFIAVCAALALLAGCGGGETAPSSAPAAGTGGGAEFVPDTKPVPPVRWIDRTVPQGTVMNLTLIDSLGSQANHAGDAFRAVLNDAVMIEGMVVVPSGSNVLGVVAKAVTAGSARDGRGGILALEFRRLETPTGTGADLQARLRGAAAPRSASPLAVNADGAVSGGGTGREALLPPNSTLRIELSHPLPIKVKQ